MTTQHIITQLRDLYSESDELSDFDEDVSGTSSLSENSLTEEKNIDVKEKTLLDTILPFEIADDFSSLLDKIQQIQVKDEDVLPLPLPIKNGMIYKVNNINNDNNYIKNINENMINDERKDKNSNTKNAIIHHHKLIDNNVIKDETNDRNTIQGSEMLLSPPLPNNQNQHHHSFPLNTPNLSIFSPTSTTYSEDLSPSLSSSASSPPILSPTFSTKTSNSKWSIKSTRSTTANRGRLKKKSDSIYHPRTYEEMMRIPDRHERIRFYEKTYQLCIQTESPLTLWLKKCDSIKPIGQIKDITSPKPNISMKSPSIYPSLKSKFSENPLGLSPSNNNNNNNSFGSFFHKSSSKIMNNNNININKPLPDIDSQTQSIKRTPKLSKSMNFRNSFSSLQKLPSAKITPLLSRSRVYDKSVTLSTIPKKKSLFNINHKSNNNSPSLSKSVYISPPLELKNYQNQHHHYDKHHLHDYQYQQHYNHNYNNNSINESALLEMQHILPQLDTSILQSYLTKANGDIMVAITMAIQNMKA
ncbi:unnamed protein product [Cunninghamella blakesleeana]